MTPDQAAGLGFLGMALILWVVYKAMERSES